MTANRLGKAQQVLLLCALALCVAAMHHVTMSNGLSTAATSHVMTAVDGDMAAPVSGDHGGHDPGAPDMLHLCLAVLCVVGGLLVAVAVFRWFSRRPGRHASTSPRGSPVRDRPPDRRARVLLASLCVLRL